LRRRLGLRSVFSGSGVLVAAAGSEGAISGQVVSADVVRRAAVSVVGIVAVLAESANSVGEITAEHAPARPRRGCLGHRRCWLGFASLARIDVLAVVFAPVTVVVNYRIGPEGRSLLASHF